MLEMLNQMKKSFNIFKSNSTFLPLSFQGSVKYYTALNSTYEFIKLAAQWLHVCSDDVISN